MMSYRLLTLRHTFDICSFLRRLTVAAPKLTPSLSCLWWLVVQAASSLRMWWLVGAGYLWPVCRCHIDGGTCLYINLTRLLGDEGSVVWQRGFLPFDGVSI